MSDRGTSAEWDPASFRDARGRVFVRRGRVFRALTPSGESDWRSLSANPVWANLQQECATVRTWEPSDVQVEPPAVSVLEHAPVSFVSYAYEWPFSLLKDAAMLYITLLDRLMPAGFTLIDGTSRNVMFEGLRPILVDVLLIAPRRRGAIWLALNQFLESMVYPLMIAVYKGISYHAWLRGAPDLALPTGDVAKLFGCADSLKPGVVTLLKLKHVLDRFGPGEGVTPTTAGSEVVDDDRVFRHTLDRLEKVIARLKPRYDKSGWTSYEDCVASNYGDDAHRRKRSVIDAALGRTAHAGVVWDLGCNTGRSRRWPRPTHG